MEDPIESGRSSHKSFEKVLNESRLHSEWVDNDALYEESKSSSIIEVETPVRDWAHIPEFGLKLSGLNIKGFH